MTGDNRIPVLTIDGPSGAGKGTIARQVVLTTGWHLLDSGALYRLTGLYCKRRGVDPGDAAAAAELAAELPVEFSVGPYGERILLDGHEVSDEIRTEACGALASQVAALQPVREALLQRQRDFRQPPGLVADGRDMGTVVFPDAEIKVFLTASPHERAQRRYNQLKEQGADVSLACLAEEIAERDRRDASRSAAPLVAAADAQLIDTTGIGVDAVVERVLALIARR